MLADVREAAAAASGMFNRGRLSIFAPCVREEREDDAIPHRLASVDQSKFHQGRFSSPSVSFDPQEAIVFMYLMRIEPVKVVRIFQKPSTRPGVGGLDCHLACIHLLEP